MSNAPLTIRHFEFLENLIQGRSLRRARIALASGLQQVNIEVFFVPRIERLAAEMLRQRMRSADDLAFFNRQICVAAALIAGNRVDLCTHRQLENFCDDVI